MDTEAKKILLGLILKNLHYGNDTLSVFDIKSIATDDISSVDVSEALSELITDKIVSRVAHRQYRIVADIESLRDYILKSTIAEESPVADKKTVGVDLQTIINSTWTLSGYEEEYCDRTSAGDSSLSAADGLANFEKLRRELTKQVADEITESDNENSADDADFGWAFDDDDDDDEEESGNLLYIRALRYCIEQNKASTALIQRRFPLGYLASCRIINWMEENEFISPPDGGKPRKVLITKKEYNEKFDYNPFTDVDDEADVPRGKYFTRNGQTIREELLGKLPSVGAAKGASSAVQSLVTVLGLIAEKKSAPITCEEAPGWSLWNFKDFEEAVVERLERIVKSDKRMGRQGAIKKAETYLEAVRDTHDRKMVQVYERIVYEFKTASDYIYRQIKKRIFDEGE